MAALLDQLKKKVKQSLDDFNYAVNSVNPRGDTDPNQTGNQNLWTTKVAPAAQKIVQKYTPFADPTSNNGDNFWSSPVAGVMAGHTQLPKIRLKPISDQVEKIKNPVLKFGAEAGVGMAEDLANTPRNLLQAPINIARDVNTGERDPRKFAGDLAPFAEGMLNIGTLGGTSVAKGVVKQGLKEGLKEGIKRGAIEGAKYGAAYGALGGMESGRDITDPAKYAENLALNTGAGVGGGMVIGGVTGGVPGAVSDVIRKSIKKLFPKASEKQVAQLADEYVKNAPQRMYARTKTGQFATGDAKPFVPAGRNYAVPRSTPIKITHWMDRVDQDLMDNMPQPGLSVKLVKKESPVVDMPQVSNKFSFNDKLGDNEYNVFNSAFQKAQDILDIDPELRETLPRDITGKDAYSKINGAISLGQEPIDLIHDITTGLKQLGYEGMEPINKVASTVTKTARNIQLTPEKKIKLIAKKTEEANKKQIEDIGKFFDNLEQSPAQRVKNYSRNPLMEKQARTAKSRERIDLLFNYNRKLADLGYTTEQIAGIGAPQARKILENNVTPQEYTPELRARFQKEIDERFAAENQNHNLPQQEWNQEMQGLRDKAAEELKSKEKPGFLAVKDVLKKKNVEIEGNPEPLPWEAGKPQQKKIKIKVGVGTGKNTEELPQYTQANVTAEAGRAQYNATENKQAFDQMFAKWVGKRDAAGTTGTQLGVKYKGIPKEKGMDVIDAMENPSEASSEIKQYIDPLHKEFDRLYDEADKAGIDIGYRENYITHFWDKSEDQVKKEYQIFKQKEFIQNERQVPTYREGIAMGLKPKYTQPAPIIADYAQRLERLKANIEFLKEAKKEGFIVDASVGTNAGFVPISAPGFPKSVSKNFEGKTVVGSFYAPEPIAKEINRIFAPEDNGVIGAVTNVTGKASSTLQDVTLSGGIPATPLNAFTIAQMQKEFLSGRVGSPVVSFLRSMSPGHSEEFFQKNASTIKKMQLRNVPVNSTFTVKDALGEPPKSLPGWISTIWSKGVNEPTFGRFMPMLQINLFNDIEKAALKAKKDPEVAADIAAKAVQQFYGSTSSADEAKRTKLGRNVLKTLLFAPKYRESMWNFWINNAKALSPIHVAKDGNKVTGIKFNNPLSLENRTNTKFIFGAGITLGTMNYLNEVFNGHGMADNPTGKEDKLLIPVSKITGDESDDTVIGIPYLSSIATIPRAMFREGKMLAQGDVSGAVRDAGQSYTSMLVKPVADVANNSDYFGKKIVEESDTPQQKFAKQGAYLATQYTGHPYVKEAIDPRNQDDPLYQRASRMMELPLRFYSKQGMTKSEFYDEYYKLKPIAEKYEELTYKDPEQAQTFLTENQDKIDKFNYMKQVQSAYYEGADQGNANVSILSKVKEEDLPSGVTKAGSRIIYKNEKGNYENINLSDQPSEPTLTGKEELDKKLLSKYRGEITSKANDIRKLYELGVISADEAEQQLTSLETMRSKYATSGKKPSVEEVKLPKLKVSRPASVKFAPIKLTKNGKINIQTPARKKQARIKIKTLSKPKIKIASSSK